MKKFALALVALLLGGISAHAQQTSAVYITGDATEYGWTLANPDGSGMTLQSDGTYTWSGKLRQGYFFRFLTSASWSPTYTAVDDNGTTVTEGTYPVQYDIDSRPSDPAFKVGIGGIYTVTLDTGQLTMTLRLDQEIIETDLYMIGAGSPAGWSTGNARDWKFRQEGNRYTWTGPLTRKSDDAGDGRFFFLANSANEWWPRYTSDDISIKSRDIEPGKTYTIRRYETNEAEQLQGWQDPAFVVATPGIYTITVDLSDDLSTGTFSIAPATVCVIGPAVSGSWNSNELSKYKFISNGDGTYTYTGNLSLEAENRDDSGKFRFSKPGDWWPAFVPADNANVSINREGRYDIRWAAGESPVFKINTDGNFTIDLDLNGERLAMFIKRNGNIVDIPDDALSELFICGNALNGIPGGWSQNDDYIRPMKTTDTPGQFVWTGDLYADGEFKFRYNGPENGDWGGFVADYPENLPVATEATCAIAATGEGVPDSKFIVTETGRYTISVSTYGDNKTMTISEADKDAASDISADSNAVTVTGRRITAGGRADIFDLTGRRIASLHNSSATVAHAGVYIVRTNDTVTKIIIK